MSVTGSQTQGYNATITVATLRSFCNGDVTVTEGGDVVVTITRSGCTIIISTVTYATADGSAVGGGDYLA